MQYKPKLLVGGKSVAPPELGMEDRAPDLEPTEPPKEMLKDMTSAESALRKPIHLPPKARFTDGPHIHV